MLLHPNTRSAFGFFCVISHWKQLAITWYLKLQLWHSTGIIWILTKIAMEARYYRSPYESLITSLKLFLYSFSIYTNSYAEHLGALSLKILPESGGVNWRNMWPYTRKKQSLISVSVQQTQDIALIICSFSIYTKRHALDKFTTWHLLYVFVINA